MQLAGKLHWEMLLGLALRGAGAISSFALVWMIARIFGAEVVGLYQMGVATVTLCALAVVMGLDILLVRELSVLLAAGKLGEARAAFTATRAWVLKVGIPAAIALAALAIPLSKDLLGAPRLADFLVVFAPAAVLLALLRLSNALLRTTGRVVASQSLEGVTYTTLAMLALACAWLLDWQVFELLPPIAYVCALALTAGLSMLLAQRTAGRWPEGPRARLRHRAGVTVAAGPITALAGEWLVLAAITAIAGLADTGIFRTAFQICMLFHLVNTSFGVMAGPHLAKAAAARDAGSLRRIVLLAGILGLLICVPLALLGLLAPAWLMGLFGDEFRSGALALQILVVGQLINVGFGPVGTGMVMMHRERTVLVIEGLASSTGVAIALLTLGSAGIAGAAVGMLCASAIRNIGNAMFFYRAVVRLASPGSGSAG